MGEEGSSMLGQSKGYDRKIQGPMDDSEVGLITPSNPKGPTSAISSRRLQSQSLRDLTQGRPIGATWEVMPHASNGRTLFSRDEPRTPMSHNTRRFSSAIGGFGSAVRRSGRFDAHDVLNALSSAPPLPSPALTMRHLDWSVGGLRESMSMVHSPAAATPKHHNFNLSTHGHVLNAQSPDAYRLDRMERSTWLPSPTSVEGKANASADLTTAAGKVVLGTQEPEFLSLLERSLVQRVEFSDSSAALGKDALAAHLKCAEAEPKAMDFRHTEMTDDLEVEEVWEDLMQWCVAHDESIDYRFYEHRETLHTPGIWVCPMSLQLAVMRHLLCRSST